MFDCQVQKNTANFYPEREKGSGRKLGKCIRFKDKCVTPSEFESMSTVQANKWKQSIKFDGKPIGEWLSMNENYTEALVSRENTEVSLSPSSGNSSSHNDEGENTSRQESMSQDGQASCMNNTSGATNKGSDKTRETLELTFTQSSTPTLVDSDMEDDQVTGTKKCKTMKTTGDYTVPFHKLERKLSDALPTMKDPADPLKYTGISLLSQLYSHWKK